MRVRNLSRFYVLGLFFITAAVTFSVVLIASTPATPAPPPVLPTPTPPDACAISPTGCLYATQVAQSDFPAPYPTATAALAEDQCGLTGETYAIGFDTDQFGASTPQGYRTYPSPDGRYLFYKEGNDVFIKAQDGTARRLGSDEPFGDIIGRVFWSPNSEYVMFTPNVDYRPTVFVAASGEAHHLTSIDAYLDFRGWLPDGEHFIYGNNDGLTVSLWSAKTGAELYQTEHRLGYFEASPDGHWLAYTWTDDRAPLYPTYGLTLVSSDGTHEQKRVVGAADLTVSSTFPPNGKFLWSPDSRWVAIYSLIKGDRIYQRTTFFNTDGTVVTTGMLASQVTYPLDSTNLETLWSQQARWTADGNEFHSVQGGDGSFAWTAYTPTTRTSRTIADNLFKPPFYSASGKHVGLYTRAGDGYSIQIADAEGRTLSTLVENASDAGDPDWSPDERWVAVVWAEGEQEQRQIHLSWMHPDGSEPHDVMVNFKDVRELRWMDDGAKLAYIAWRGDAGNSIEVVDTVTGAREVWAEKLESISDVTYDADAHSLSFGWQTPGTLLGHDTFSTDGSRLEHIEVRGNEFHRPLRQFWSPDGQTIALKLGWGESLTEHDEMLVLAYTDGREPVMVREGLDGLGDPLWSPDSRQLAFTQWIQNGGYWNPATLQVVSADGKTLWSNNEFTLGSALDWFKCVL